MKVSYLLPAEEPSKLNHLTGTDVSAAFQDRGKTFKPELTSYSSSLPLGGGAEQFAETEKINLNPLKLKMFLKTRKRYNLRCHGNGAEPLIKACFNTEFSFVAR